MGQQKPVLADKVPYPQKVHTLWKNLPSTLPAIKASFILQMMVVESHNSVLAVPADQ